MKAIKIEYTVKPEYVTTNKANIQKVIEELRASGSEGVQYSVYTKEDGCSFVHFVVYTGDNNIIPTLESFKAFSAQLRAEGLVAPPQSTHLDMVGKSFEL